MKIRLSDLDGKSIEVEGLTMDRLDGIEANCGLSFIFRRSDGQVMGALTLSSDLWVGMEYQIIAAHYARIEHARTQILPGAEPGYTRPAAPGSAEMAIDELHVTRSHAALKREHEELMQKYSNLTGQFEALQRDCHGDYSRSRTYQIDGKEPQPLTHVSPGLARIPRSGDMSDVVAASVRRPED